VRVGGTLELLIPFIPAPSHLWRLEGADSVLAVEGDRFEHSPVVQHRFRLRALAVGEIEVRAVYIMPWGGTPREVRTYTVIVDA
ncbi:MAG: protease inhibitor I42 family protein, partial [Acidimicrobiales bacterium]